TKVGKSARQRISHRFGKSNWKLTDRSRVPISIQSNTYGMNKKYLLESIGSCTDKLEKKSGDKIDHDGEVRPYFSWTESYDILTSINRNSDLQECITTNARYMFYRSNPIKNRDIVSLVNLSALDIPYMHGYPIVSYRFFEEASIRRL
ncbi:hypothetical protein L9F63_006237, partial [Diploptera punctata]